MFFVLLNFLISRRVYMRAIKRNGHAASPMGVGGPVGVGGAMRRGPEGTVAEAEEVDAIPSVPMVGAEAYMLPEPCMELVDWNPKVGMEASG
jgi:hypothetical protein